jgi:hypothetical protein
VAGTRQRAAGEAEAESPAAANRAVELAGVSG